MTLLARVVRVSAISFLSFFAVSAQAVLTPPAATEGVDPTKETQGGIPVTDRLTVEKCGSCHQADSHGNLTRISWLRTTPEGWQESIKRMVELNGVKLSATEAHQIVRYLAADHGLAPEEAEPVRWYMEGVQPQSETYPSPAIRHACASCHEFARPQSWRRSDAEWHLLRNMHLGYFPLSQFVAFEEHVPHNANADPNAPKPKQPVDEALAYLTKNENLYSAAWSSWHAQMTDPDLSGSWLVNATAPGKGKYFGEMTVTRTSPGEFKTETTLTSAQDGTTLKLAGHSFLYTGYEWRGSVNTQEFGPLRQVMALSPDQAVLQGRWFWGVYQEFGFTVTGRRKNGDTVIEGTDVTSLRAGAKGVPMKVHGLRLPLDLKPADIGLGSGVTVSKIVSVKPNVANLLVDIQDSVPPGKRNIAIRGHVATDAFSVYDKIEYIKVSSETALAHTGGTVAKKGFVQFEAHGFANGLDGLPNTADDVDLGPVPVKWSVEEFISHNGDTDKEFVGFIDQNGLFTPSGDGPNPQRHMSADNIGDVWVVARYSGPETSPKKPLESKSYLVVAIPDFLRFDESGVGGSETLAQAK